ncbi:hypothetical protein K8R03_04680 [Candidatus Kaiserbacteria bacterium]|nr:hypothetical protein [Candidatus Kaiserbacteria bacterium]
MNNVSNRRGLSRQAGFVTLPLLAVIVLAGVISGLAMKTPAPHTSQLAEAAISLETNKSSPDSCTTAIQRAVTAQGENDGTVTSVDDKSKFQKLDSCFGAVLKPGSKSPYKTSDYKCVGREGTVTITSKSATAVTTAQDGVPIGKCQITSVNGDPLSSGGTGTGPDAEQQSVEDIQKQLDATRKDVSLLEAKQASAEQGVGEFTQQDSTALSQLKTAETNYSMQIEAALDKNAGPNEIDAQAGADPGASNDNLLNPSITTGNNTSILQPGFSNDNLPQTTGFNENVTQSASTFDESGFVTAQQPSSTFDESGFSGVNWQDTPALEPTVPDGVWDPIGTTDEALAQTGKGGIGSDAVAGGTAGDITTSTGRESEVVASKDASVPDTRTTPPTNTPTPQPDPRKEGPGTGTGAGTGSGTGTGSDTGAGGGSGSGGLGGLSALLQSLMKGLGQSQSPQQQAQQCSSDPTQAQAQQQQYNQQLQQYNYQMQLYQQQLQQSQLYGTYGSFGSMPVAPTPPQPCTPGGGGGQCTNIPQPSASTCANGTLRPTLSGNCIVSWQCVPNTACGASPEKPSADSCVGGTWQPTYQTGTSCVAGWSCSAEPAARISCSPATADVGSEITLVYGCNNAATSTGSGFDTNGALTGTSTVTAVRPEAGTTTIAYGVSCISGDKKATAQCSVEVAQSVIVLTANPKVVPYGTTSTIGWVTGGMQACVISSPQSDLFTEDNADLTSTTGTAETPPLTEDADYVLTCETTGGSIRSATTTVLVSDAPVAGEITVRTSITGTTSVTHGATMHVSWTTADAPAGSVISLWVYENRRNRATALVASAKATSGSYDWQIPAADSACLSDSPYACASDLVTGRSYAIEAALYTPSNAYLGGFPPPNPVMPTYLGYGFGEDFTMGQ